MINPVSNFVKFSDLSLSTKPTNTGYKEKILQTSKIMNVKQIYFVGYIVWGYYS